MEYNYGNVRVITNSNGQVIRIITVNGGGGLFGGLFGGGSNTNIINIRTGNRYPGC